jgi:hypothetical protein
MSKLNGVRVVEIPKFKAVTSGPDTFDSIFGEDGFGQWIESHQHLVKDLLYASPDFLWHEDDDINKSVWIWAIKDCVTEADTTPYKIIDYDGGIFVVATADENDNNDLNEVVSGMLNWIENSDVFERDERPGHKGMGHCIGCNVANKVMGITQQEIFLPVKLKGKL